MGETLLSIELDDREIAVIEKEIDKAIEDGFTALNRIVGKLGPLGFFASFGLRAAWWYQGGATGARKFFMSADKFELGGRLLGGIGGPSGQLAGRMAGRALSRGDAALEKRGQGATAFVKRHTLHQRDEQTGKTRFGLRFASKTDRDLSVESRGRLGNLAHRGSRRLRAHARVAQLKESKLARLKAERARRQRNRNNRRPKK